MTKSTEKKISRLVHSVEPSAEFTEKLWQDITYTQIAEPPKGLYRRWAPAAVVIAMVIALAIITPQRALAGLRSLFDFLPGIGLVQIDESTLYLAEPVVVEQEGITLTIERVVADTNKTSVLYRIDNLPLDGTSQHTGCFYDSNRLLLPDGKNLLPIGGGVRTNLDSNVMNIDFMTLPEGVSRLTLLASLNDNNSSCSAPEEWRVDFSLGTTKPADMVLIPVVDSPTNTPAKDPGSETGDITDISTGNGIKFIVDRTVLLGDGYILYGHSEYANKNWMDVRIDWNNLYALDANGEKIELEMTNDSIEENGFSIHIASNNFIPPLTVYIGGARVSATSSDFPTFSFDAGTDPQVGQNWIVNQQLEVEGQDFSVVNVQAVQEPEESAQGRPQNGYSFEIRHNLKTSLDGLIVCSGLGDSVVSWSQSAMPDEDGTKVFETYFEGELPSGLVSCGFRHVHFTYPGSWEFEWYPPDSEK